LKTYHKDVCARFGKIWVCNNVSMERAGHRT
jgi:hypothetical protein